MKATILMAVGLSIASISTFAATSGVDRVEIKEAFARDNRVSLETKNTKEEKCNEKAAAKDGKNDCCGSQSHHELC